MGNTLITYRDKYYEYDGDQEISNKCLTIGGYESAWLADLVAAFILEETKSQFTDTKYYGIYRDDGLVILNGKKSKEEIENWLQTFQQKVDETLQDNGLIFTCCLWNRNFKGDKKELKGKKVSVDINDYFPYLDMQFLWDEKNKLKFEVYLKPGQRLK